METFATWLNTHGRSPRTIAAYVQALSQFERWYRGTYDADADYLTASDMREYRSWLSQRHSAATVNLHLAALRAYCRCLGVEVAHVRGPGRALRAPRWLNRRDLGRLLNVCEAAVRAASTDHAERAAVRNLAIVTVLAQTGLRVAELCSLTLDSLRVPERGDGWIRVTGKGERVREVPLSLSTRRALRAWLDLRGYEAGSVFGVKENAVQRLVSACARSAGLHATPHTLRHTYAHEMRLSGASMETVADLLGHASLDTTRIYTQPGQAELEQAVEKTWE